MATVTVKTDTQVNIVRTRGFLPLIGFDSKFDTEPHPTSQNTIQGWLWDKRIWSNELELSNEEFAQP